MTSRTHLLSLPDGVEEMADGRMLFSISAPSAHAMNLLLYSTEQKLIGSYALEQQSEGSWQLLLEPPSPPFFYRYQLETAEGETREVVDPYAPFVESPSSWGEKPYWAYGLYAHPDPFDWDEVAAPHHPLEALILYELHLHPFAGNFSALREKIPYLQELGVTAVELLPIFEWDENSCSTKNPHTGTPHRNCWGYAPLHFFAPMNRYGPPAQPGELQALATRRAFQELVRECHRAGIEVILDVVYNHLGSSTTSCLPALDLLAPQEYLIVDDQGSPTNFTGCGNTLSANHPLTQTLILRSLRFWVEVMGVDGFRFDLAASLRRGREGTLLENPPLIQAISQDPLLKAAKLFAEPWDPATAHPLGLFAARGHWTEWNDRYRNATRRYIRGAPGSKAPFADGITGTASQFGIASTPTATLNFITCHDGFTLWDLVSYEEKQNLLNGEGNRDGTNQNESWNGGVEGESSDEEILKIRERQVRNFALALFLSHGIPMMRMGDELLKSAQGNNNLWCQEGDLAAFPWERLSSPPSFTEFLKKLIAFRKRSSLLQRNTFATEEELTWVGDPHWDSLLLAYTLQNTEEQLYIAFYSGEQEIELTLPPPLGKPWRLLCDTKEPDFFLEGEGPLAESPYLLSGKRALLLQSWV